VPQIAWLYPLGSFTDVVSVWRKLGVTKDPDTGALVEDWQTTAADWDRSWVTPVTESDLVVLGERYRGAQWMVYCLQKDDGTLPDVDTDDHVTWTDGGGRIHTLNVLFYEDEAGAYICKRVPCTELVETG
jgi:hypothetical protein